MPKPAAQPARGTQQKILQVADLAALRARLRDKTIVLCHGAFDLVHAGHLLHFEEARALGDVLVVTITGDQYITKKRSVSLTEEHRTRQVAALEVVDYVAIVNEPSAVAAIEALQPDIYVKGPEYSDLLLDKTTNIFREKALVESYGGRVHFTKGETFSSTKLSHFLGAAPEAVQDNPLLRNDRVRFRDVSKLGFTLEDVKRFLVRAADLRVCVLGETIIDEWVDIAVTNLSPKSRCVAGLETGRIQQTGGAGVVALHLASFVKSVDCFTNGLDGDLPKNIRVTRMAPKSLVKTRFVDKDSGSPLFESKNLDLSDVSRDMLPDFSQFDLILVADYGHGLIDAAAVNKRIADDRRGFVAAMAQVNSTNYGYNLPIKYVHADYYSVNRTEAELCVHERGLPLPELVARMSSLLQCEVLSITDGARGVRVRVGPETFDLPTLSTTVVDTIGCGDAYFALSSVAAALKLPASLIALTGSIGAAAMAQRRCNERPVTDTEFLTIAKIVI